MADPSIVRFRGVVQRALAELEGRREEVNDLNVFPVADGDTGDNMALTLRAVLDELDRLSGEGEIDEIGRDEIVDSVARAALLAEVLERALDAGQSSVRRGPDLLPVLREAGVVDAGGFGLTVIFAGVVAALRGTEAPELDHHEPARVTHPQHESSTFRYCTNFAVTGVAFEPTAWIDALEEIGDSVLVHVGDVDEIGRDEIVDSVACAALLGARGNSGVILSHLIRGARHRGADENGVDQLAGA